MTFREFLIAWQADFRYARNPLIKTLLALPDMPDTFADDRAMRSFMRAAGVHATIRHAATTLWWRYQRVLGGEWPVAPKAVADAMCGHPAGAQTVLTFRAYLQSRMTGERGALNQSVAMLLTLADWPDAFDSTADLRAWLTQAGAPRALHQAAGGLWVSYKQALKARGLEMPRKARDAVYSVPKGSDAVVDAPTLERLADLDRELRMVAIRDGGGPWRWQGDLSDVVQQRVYYVMRDIAYTLTQLTRYAEGLGARRQMLFAKLADSAKPSAYRTAAARVEADVARNPRWLRTGRPQDGLEALR